MPDCPLADECPSFSEPIDGMGCQHYGDKGGKEWCNHYSQPIEDLKTQPVKPGEEIVVEVGDIHESGAGVGRTDDGFIVMVDGVLPEARARVEITKVSSNVAWADEIERLPLDPEDETGDEDGSEDEDAADEAEDGAEADADDETAADTDDEIAADADDADDGDSGYDKRERLGSRDNFWGG